jgi:uncharacterized protein (TIGR03435 family)
MRWIFVCLTLATSLASAQEFEVVSIKPNHSGDGSSSSHSDPGRLTATNNSLRVLFQMAYGLPEYRVDGPAWLSTEHYDLAAKFPEELPKDRLKYQAGLEAMLQKMLQDRFHVAVHWEERTMAVYGLVVDKKGAKFEEVPEGPSHSNSNNNHYEGTAMSMANFATVLSRRMDLPVIDMTGLKGFYNLKLDWVPEPRRSPDGTAPDTDAPAGPRLPEALQDQLGLKLEHSKAPIDVLVVDRADKIPAENL